MASEKNMRMEEIKNGQQEMQEKIAQMTKIVTSLTKGKRIIDDPSLQSEPMYWKDDIDPSIVPNPNDLCQRRKLRKESSGQSKHVDKQQRCSLLDKKLKEIEGVNDLGSVDPRELCLVPNLVIPPKSKTPTFEKYDGTKCFENYLATYCNKMARHVHDENLLIHVFYDSLTRTAAQWYTIEK